MRDSFDLFHWFGWQHLFRYWEWGYVWDDTFAWRICRLVVRENVFTTNRELRFALDSARTEFREALAVRDAEISRLYAATEKEKAYE